MLERGQALHDQWMKIPEDTDVLITHGPPKDIGDEASAGLRCQNVGCVDLLHRIERLRLKAHIFGHIHEGDGEYALGHTRLINASTCALRYAPENSAIVLDI
jgi:Icc-related predicted phosphoesterase